MIDDIFSLKPILSEDIFRYVVGNTLYCPIEKQIDPKTFEIYDTCIYNGNTKEFVTQSEDFVNFKKHLTLLKQNAPKMGPLEINKVCKSIASIAPTNVKI